jgi:hypothetical protein
MTRLKVLFAALLIALAALAIACGDDDDTSTSTPTDDAPVTASPSDGDETPTDDGDETTPPDEKTPIGGDGNGGQTTAPTSDATPAAEGIRAVQQPNYPDWLAQNYPDVSPVEAPCAYNPATVTATCDGEDYAVDPPLTGEDISCFTQNVNAEPVAIRCTSQSPLTTIYYVIQS